MARIFFEVEGLSGSMEEPEITAVQLIAKGAETYLEGSGRHSIKPSEDGTAEIMVASGEAFMRLGGELIARVFDITPHAAARLVDKAVQQTDSIYSTQSVTSFVAARVVEGFLEANQRELATGLFDLRVREPHTQQQVLKFLLNRDPDVVSN